MSFFDAYEIRARLIPAALIASPLLLPLFAFGWATASTITSTALASAVVLMLVYVFSHIVAFLGRKCEPALWQSWGGSPSLTVLMEADSTFPAATKKVIQRAIRDIYSIDLEAVAGDSTKWREQATEAFGSSASIFANMTPKAFGVFRMPNMVRSEIPLARRGSVQSSPGCQRWPVVPRLGWAKECRRHRWRSFPLQSGRPCSCFATPSFRR